MPNWCKLVQDSNGPKLLEQFPFEQRHEGGKKERELQGRIQGGGSWGNAPLNFPLSSPKVSVPRASSCSGEGGKDFLGTLPFFSNIFLLCIFDKNSPNLKETNDQYLSNAVIRSKTNESFLFSREVLTFLTITFPSNVLLKSIGVHTIFGLELVWDNGGRQDYEKCQQCTARFPLALPSHPPLSMEKTNEDPHLIFI